MYYIIFMVLRIIVVEDYYKLMSREMSLNIMVLYSFSYVSLKHVDKPQAVCCQQRSDVAPSAIGCSVLCMMVKQRIASW